MENLRTTEVDTAAQELNKQLFTAVERNDVQSVRALTNQTHVHRLNLESTHEPAQQTALHLACMEGYLDIVIILLNAHAPHHLLDRYERTPLHYAAMNGHLGIVDILINSGAALHNADFQGCTALHHACRTNLPSASTIMRKLIELDTTPGAIDRPAGKDCSQDTCLHFLAKHNRGDDIQWLLNRQANHKLKGDRGETAWELACMMNQHKAMGVFALKEKANQDETGKFTGPKIVSLQEWDVFEWNEKAFNLHESNWRQYALSWNSRAGVYAVLREMSENHLIDEDDPGIQRILQDLGGEPLRDMQRPRGPSCTFEIPQIVNQEHDDKRSSLNEIVPDYLSLVMPFVHSEDLNTIAARRSDKMHKNTFGTWEYCCASSPALFGVHLPLPLDEYCSPFLFDNLLTRRNKYKDQVMTRIQGSGSTHLATISQVWLWKIQNLLITSPIGVKVSDKEYLSSMDAYVVNGHSTTFPKLVGLFLSQFVVSLNNSYKFGSASESILESFERAITLVSENVNRYLEDEGIESISIKTKKKYIHEINDIREELSMIRRVLIQQEEVWKQFASNAWPNYWATGQMVIPINEWREFSLADRDLWKDVMRPQALFKTYQRRISQLDEDAERVQVSILTKLDLKQKHASLRESHSTTVMSAAVLGFTIITIIFTPLSFLMSLFALPIRQFQDNQKSSRWGEENSSGAYETGYIRKWSAITGIVSIMVTVIITWIAIEFMIGGPISKLRRKQKGKEERELSNSLRTL